MNTPQHEIFKLTGIVRDIPPAELMNGAPPVPGLKSNNVWTEGQNVHFDDGSTHRVEGYQQFAADNMPVGAFPIFTLNLISEFEAYWLYVDGQNPILPLVYVTDGQTHWDISPTIPLTGGAPGLWVSTNLNGVPILNNGVDAPLWWNGNTNDPMQPLPDWPVDTVCKSIRAFKFHLMAMDITTGGVRIKEKVIWSDGADSGSVPGSWTPLPENDAGDTLLSAGIQGAVIDAAKLRDVMIFYKAHSAYVCSYVAGQYVFDFENLFATVGIQAVNCVKEIKGKHWVFGDDDVYVHDGNAMESIIDRSNKSILFPFIAPEQHHLCFVVADVPRDEVWFCFPQVDNTYCTLALMYSYTENEFGIRDLPNVPHIEAGIVPEPFEVLTWEDGTHTWEEDVRFWNEAHYSATNDQLIMCDPLGGLLHELGASHSANGKPIEAYVTRQDWVLGGEAAMWSNTMVRAIYPHITGVVGEQITVYVAATQTPGEGYVWQTIETFTIPVQDFDEIKIDCMAHGRYVHFKFSSSGGTPWEVHRVGFEYVTEAKF